MSSRFNNLPSYYTLPDTLRNWPWQRRDNPWLAEVKRESSAWAESFQAFSPRAQNAFNMCDFNLLAALAYPTLSREGCRIGADLMNLYFVIDEYSDVADTKLARIQADIIMDALRNPLKPRPAGEWVGGECTRSYWENTIHFSTPACQRHFLILQQADDRGKHIIRTLDDYFALRRETVGAKPSYIINEINLNLPDDVLLEENMQILIETATDMIIIANDLFSWNVEQAKGDDLHNCVTIIMHHLGLDHADALAYISDLHDHTANRFFEAQAKVPSTGSAELDAEVDFFVDGLGMWVRANDQWSFEGKRYFGPEGLTIQKTRYVKRLSKIGGEDGQPLPEYVIDAPRAQLAIAVL
ncbi:terpenoid synthase [Mucidula mucida]|nr:terpenoid synthase [Mucidula mucida]